MNFKLHFRLVLAWQMSPVRNFPSNNHCSPKNLLSLNNHCSLNNHRSPKKLRLPNKLCSPNNHRSPKNLRLFMVIHRTRTSAPSAMTSINSQIPDFSCIKELFIDNTNMSVEFVIIDSETGQMCLYICLGNLLLLDECIVSPLPAWGNSAAGERRCIGSRGFTPLLDWGFFARERINRALLGYAVSLLNKATAAEVQNHLVSGRKIEALHCAQQGQLWGPAIFLRRDQFYGETVKQMARRKLVPGSLLRTMCLLIADEPADVFSLETPSNGSMLGAANINQQSTQVVIAAHVCYLVAEAKIEPCFDTARLCLVGADHWKFPRTYASPETIQGGFSTNLAPANLVDKFLNIFDATVQRVVGGLPPPGPSASGGSLSVNDHQQQGGSSVSASQSTMAMLSLVDDSA